MLKERNHLRILAEYLTVCTASAGLFILFFKPFCLQIDIPFHYGGDSLWNSFVIKTILENGWYTTNPALGAPFVANPLDFAKPESLYLLLIKIFGLFSKNFGTINNLFYFVSFLTVSCTALWVMRHWGITFPLALTGSLLFTFLPYHLYRIDHLFLASYFIVPLAIWIAARIHTGQAFFFTEKGFSWRPYSVIAVVIIIGSCSGYYAFFSSLLILAAGMLGAIEHRRWQLFASAGLIATAILIMLLLNTTPTFIYHWRYGNNPEATQRSLAQSEIYGLKISQLLLPQAEHRLHVAGQLTQSYNKEAPLVNENQIAGLGLIGSIGFLVLLTVTLLRRPVDNQRLRALANLNLVALLYGTIGGFGVLFTLLIHPQIRALNRISVFIAFSSISAILIIVQCWLDSHANLIIKQTRSYIVISVLLLIGLLDQIPMTLTDALHINPEQNFAEFSNDFDFVTRIESAMPEGAMIYQLPYVRFPETPATHTEGIYGMLRGYLHSRHLRWSYGGIKGRETDLWLQEISNLPLDQQMHWLESVGFGGIYIERRGFNDNAAVLEQQLSHLIGGPLLTSRNGHLAFYKLPLDQEIKSPPSPMLGPGRGFYRWDGQLNGERWLWSWGNAELYLFNPHPQAVTLSFQLDTLEPRQITIHWHDWMIASYSLMPSQPIAVELNLCLLSVANRISFKTDIPAQLPGNGDTRKLAFSIKKLALKPSSEPQSCALK